jgi:phosphoglycolate phosphatase-like HAD superfamily hydrolase
MIKIVALDVDGVVIDSVHENFIVCQKVLEKRGEKLADDNRFMQGRNYLRSGKSLYGIVELVKQGTNFDKINQEEFDRFINKHKSESIKFSKDFFTMRKKLQDEDYDKWFSLNRIFPGIKNTIEKLSKKFIIVVISTKDFYSISTAFDRVGIDIKKDNIFSKEISENKADQIKNICKKFTLKPEEIFFLDDQPKNLEDVKRLGAKVALAGWGYNNDTQKAETRQQGIPIIEKPEKIEETIKRFNQEKD